MSSADGSASESSIDSMSTGNTSTGTSIRAEIPEDAAQDHERLLALVAHCLAEVGVGSSLTTFHQIVRQADACWFPARYQPKLEVWRGARERDGIAFTVRVAVQGGRTFYTWGQGLASAHPARHPVGAVVVIAEAVEACHG
jgi:hypothetical protein